MIRRSRARRSLARWRNSYPRLAGEFPAPPFGATELRGRDAHFSGDVGSIA